VGESSKAGPETELFLGFNDALESVSSATDAMASSSLFEFFLQTVISYAVPTFFTLLTIGFSAFLFKKSKGDEDFVGDNKSALSELYSDLYGDESKKNFSPFGKSNKSSRPVNLGIPSKEYIKVTNLNEKFESYDFSLAKATGSKASAAAQYRSRSFNRALDLALDGDELPAYAKSQLLEAEQMFLQQGRSLVQKIQSLDAQMIKERVDAEMQNMGMEKLELDPKPLNETSAEKNNTSAAARTSKPSKSKAMQELPKLQKSLKELELDFIANAVSVLGPERAVGLREALLGDVLARGTGGLLTQLEARPLSALLKGSDNDKKSLFVMKFPGDVTASQLNELREEATAIIRSAKPGDEVLVILQSGGGTVTGYGLAAGQLVRLKNKGLFLTIAVEQVAASGGYMMTCVADRIVASPFAVLGSIGVISEIPNAYERLKKEGIEFQTVTAGEFKRTLTPTKKITREDINKATDDVEAILTQFKEWVHTNRPQLDIPSVATGETWFGEAALEKGLCDEIRPVDDVLLQYVDLGYNVYEVAYSPPPEVPQGLSALLPVGSVDAEDANTTSLSRRLIRWVVTSVAEEVKSSIADASASASSPAKKYMARDDTADQVKIKDQLW